MYVYINSPTHLTVNDRITLHKVLYPAMLGFLRVDGERKCHDDDEEEGGNISV